MSLVVGSGLRVSAGSGAGTTKTLADLQTFLAAENPGQVVKVTDRVDAPNTFTWAYSTGKTWKSVYTQEVVSTDPINSAETRKLGFLGDSRAYLSFSTPGGLNTFYRNTSSATWIASATLGKFVFPVTLINGVAGDTSTGCLTRIPAHISAMQAEGATRTFFVCSTNDRVSGISKETSLANIQAGCKMYSDVGISVDVVSETPRGNGSSQYELTASQKVDHKWVHDQIELLGPTWPKVRVHNWWDAMLDTSSGTNYYVKPGYTVDGIHASKLGGYYQSKVSGPKLLEIGTGLLTALPITGAFYDPATNPEGSILLNPLLAGNGGSQEGGTNVTGVLPPTSWILGGENMGGITGVASNEVIDGIRYYKLRLTGTGTSGNPRLSLKQDVPMGLTSVGDPIKGVCSFISEGAGLSNIAMSMLMVPMYAVKFDAEDSDSTLPWPSENTGRRSRETPAYVREASVNGMQVRMEVSLTALTPVNATVWFATAKAFKDVSAIS